MNGKLILSGLFFIFILLSGFWLSRTGKPINVLILTIHKLISLAAIIYLGITAYRVHQLMPLEPLEIAACAVTLLFFLAMFASGGLLSAAKPMPAVILKIHQIVPYLTILAATADLYLLLVRKTISS